VGRELAGHIQACAYLHETREQRLTDHAAVTLTLGVDSVERLEAGDPSTEDETATLF
jgi:exodeoxyribonuclease-3